MRSHHQQGRAATINPTEIIVHRMRTLPLSLEFYGATKRGSVSTTRAYGLTFNPLMPDHPITDKSWSRHFLRLHQRIEFLDCKMPELHRRFAQARVLDVRPMRNLRRVVVPTFGASAVTSISEFFTYQSTSPYPLQCLIMYRHSRGRRR